MKDLSWNIVRLAIVGLIVMYLLAGCGQPVVYTQPVVQSTQPQYQIIQDPNTGQQMAVFYDNGVQMMLEYAMFNSLMNSGGYGYVIHHYHDPGYSYRRYDSRQYSTWRNTTSTYRPQTDGYRTSTKPAASGFKNTTPAARARPFSNTSPSRPASTFRVTTPNTRSSPSSFKSTSASSRPSGSGFKRTH